jgi:hypothetical protein
MMKIKSIFLFCLLVGYCFVAGAAVSCSGKIGYLGLDQNGVVVLSNGGNIHSICSMSVQDKWEINPQACKMFYATLLANRMADRVITIYYNDQSLGACTQIGSWTNQYSAYFIQQAE